MKKSRFTALLFFLGVLNLVSNEAIHLKTNEIGPYYSVIDNTGNESEVEYVLKNGGSVVAYGYLCPHEIIYLEVVSDECIFNPPYGSSGTLTLTSGPIAACNNCSAGNNCVVTINSLDINGTLTISGGVNYWIIDN